MPLTHSAVKMWTPRGTALLLENFVPQWCNSKIFGFDVTGDMQNVPWKKKHEYKASRALAKEFHRRLLKNTTVYVPKNKGNYPKHVSKLKYPSLEHAASCSWAIFSCNLWSREVWGEYLLCQVRVVCVSASTPWCSQRAPCFPAALLSKAVHTSPCCYMCLSADYKMC